MSDKLDEAVLLGTKLNQLKRENKKLTRQLEASKKILMRIDSQREGLRQLAGHLRQTWGPLDPKEAETCPDSEARREVLQNKLKQTIEEIWQNEPYKQKRMGEFEQEIEVHVQESMSSEEKYEELLKEERLKKVKFPTKP